MNVTSAAASSFVRRCSFLSTFPISSQMFPRMVSFAFPCVSKMDKWNVKDVCSWFYWVFSRAVTIPVHYVGHHFRLMNRPQMWLILYSLTFLSFSPCSAFLFCSCVWMLYWLEISCLWWALVFSPLRIYWLGLPCQLRLCLICSLR